MTETTLPETVDIQYRDFYDVPRIFVFSVGGRWLAMDSPFDETMGEYSDVYTLYELPADFIPPTGSWEGLPQTAIRRLGDVPVASMQFDPSLRKYIRTDAIAHLLP